MDCQKLSTSVKFWQVDIFLIEHPVYYFTCHSQKYLGPCKLFRAYLVGVIACLLLTVIIGINVKNWIKVDNFFPITPITYPLKDKSPLLLEIWKKVIYKIYRQFRTAHIKTIFIFTYFHINRMNQTHIFLNGTPYILFQI